MNYKDFFFILGRYVFLLLIASFNLALLYAIFTPATIGLSYAILHVFFSNAVLLSEAQTIVIGEQAIELIPACIAGAAYYLLLILNLSTPMEFSKRIKSLLFLIGSFFWLNVLRVVFFSFLFVKKYDTYFDFAHLLVWYLGSTLLVVGLWFINVKLLSITKIPVYSDIATVSQELRKKGKKKTRYLYSKK